MQDEFKNETVLEMPEKFVIITTNPLVCYLIVEVSYTNSLLITKWIILGIELKIPKETSFAIDSIAKPIGEIKPD